MQSRHSLSRTRWTVATLRNGFSWVSVVALIGVAATYSTIAWVFPFLVDPTAEVDWLLTAIWTIMTIALVWDVSPSRDLKLIVVGLGGGLVIETWGTQTELWTYFTKERPPLWIIPAWPIAALSIDRLARIVDVHVPELRRLAGLYWLILPGFVCVFARFMWPAIQHPTSIGVLILMVAVTVVGARHDRDVSLFLAGAFFGIFLEYWGTSRRCWTYYSGQIPPVEAVLAHGFATVAFARSVQLLDGLYVQFVAWRQRAAATSAQT